MPADPNTETVDDINIDTAFRLLDKDKPRPMATCPRDDEPLIGTMEFYKAEFYCQVCGTKYGFLSPKPAVTTPELQARHDELKAIYEVERAERQANRAEPSDVTIGADGTLSVWRELSFLEVLDRIGHGGRNGPVVCAIEDAGLRIVARAHQGADRR